MVETLEQVLADEREQAAILRRNGHGHDADLLERVCDRVARASDDYLRWLSEPDARLRSGRSVAYLRSRFPEWMEAGNARLSARGKREYRAIVIPRRPKIEAIRAAARQGLERPA